MFYYRSLLWHLLVLFAFLFTFGSTTQAVMVEGSNFQGEMEYEIRDGGDFPDSIFLPRYSAPTVGAPTVGAPTVGGPAIGGPAGGGGVGNGVPEPSTLLLFGSLAGWYLASGHRRGFERSSLSSR